MHSYGEGFGILMVLRSVIEQVKQSVFSGPWQVKQEYKQSEQIFKIVSS